MKKRYILEWKRGAISISLLFEIRSLCMCMCVYTYIYGLYSRSFQKILTNQTMVVIYLEGGVGRRVGGSCFLYLYLFKFLTHQHYLLASLFSFRYTILPFENALQSSNSEITIICNLSWIKHSLELHGLVYVFSWDPD